MNNTTKKLIVLSIIIVIIICIILFTILLLNKKNNINNIDKELTTVKNSIEINESYHAKADGFQNKVEKQPSTLVKKNEFNTFSIQAVTEEAQVNKIFDDFKYNAIHHRDDSFNILNEEYREKRFGSIENYYEYLNNKKDLLDNIKAQKYLINKYDTYDQYICLDQYDNYYIFNKMPNMSYSVLLDTYTIDLPQFTEKYNKSNDGEKAGLNIDKFIEAINQKDYNFVYNVIDNSFKLNNNISNIGEFENYIKNNFFENNNVSHISAEKEGDYIIYKAKVIDKVSNQESKIMIAVIKLLEGTDFVMSFSFE